VAQVVKVTPSVMPNVLYKYIHYLLTTTVSKIVRNYLKNEKKMGTIILQSNQIKKKTTTLHFKNIIHPIIKNNFTSESKQNKGIKNMSLSLSVFDSPSFFSIFKITKNTTKILTSTGN